MAHTRIRKFNTKDTYPEQSLDNDLCQAVVAKGSMVFVRGQVGQDLDNSKSVSIGDPTGQAEQAMANINTLLEEAGAKLEHICKITIYIIDPRYREPIYRNVFGLLREFGDAELMMLAGAPNNARKVNVEYTKEPTISGPPKHVHLGVAFHRARRTRRPSPP